MTLSCPNRLFRMRRTTFQHALSTWKSVLSAQSLLLEPETFLIKGEAVFLLDLQRSTLCVASSIPDSAACGEGQAGSHSLWLCNCLNQVKQCQSSGEEGPIFVVSSCVLTRAPFDNYNHGVHLGCWNAWMHSSESQGPFARSLNWGD